MSKYLKKDKENRVTEEFKDQFPDLFQAVYDEGYQAGQSSVSFQFNRSDLDSVKVESIKLSGSNLKNENLSMSDRAKRSWDADLETQKEFCGDYEAYLAYFEANTRGQVKILGT